MATIHDKMTAIANEVRTISGATSTMGLDAMAAHISNANTSVSSEANIIAQISTALDSKAAGVNLNFDIKTYATEDELLVDKPSENTIGIITNIEINGYCFSENPPKGISEGKVWITTGKFGNSEFCLLDNEAIVVHPLCAKQYVNGAWVDVEAKSFQNDVWVDWITYLYNKGNECNSFTGGWAVQKMGNNTCGTLTKNADSMTVSHSSSSAYVNTALYCVKKIDVTNINIIGCKISAMSSPNDTPMLGISSAFESLPNIAYITCNAVGSYELDVSSAKGECYLYFRTYTASQNLSFTVSEVWFA